LRPDPESKELTLTRLHPGATVEEAKEAKGWDLRVAEERVAEDLETTDPPKREELRILRDLKTRTEAAMEAAGWKLLRIWEHVPLKKS
jgi:glutaconate CoA-transferase subunit B